MKRKCAVNRLNHLNTKTEISHKMGDNMGIYVDPLYVTCSEGGAVMANECVLQISGYY